MTCLGAKLGIRDPRNLRLSNYLTEPLLDAPPLLIDWDKPSEGAYQMWANDQVGDCVFAAFYNMLAGASKETGKPFEATNPLVLADYACVTGYDPKTGANDNGTNPEDALRYYTQKPLGDQGRIVAWGEVDRHQITEVRQALQIFGGVYTALALPKSAQAQVGDIWSVPLLPSPDRIPGSWGGHMTITRHIDATKHPMSLWTVTWGNPQQMTEAFWKKYCSAAYFFITEQWVADNGETPSGFDLDQLLADVKELQS